MITKKDLKGLSKRELKEMLCLASRWCEEKNRYLEIDNEDLKTAIRVLVDLYAGERSFQGDSYE